MRGAVVVVLRNVLPQGFDQGLCRVGFGGKVFYFTELCKNLYQFFSRLGLLVLALPRRFLLKFFVGGGFAPSCFYLGFILLDFGFVKCGKIHIVHSCFYDFTGKGDEHIQLSALQFQKAYLLL